MPSLTPVPSALVIGLLRELEAARVRLDQAPEWFARPEDTIKAGALADEVKRLCQDSVRSEDAGEIAELIERARRCLDELQALLGAH